MERGDLSTPVEGFVAVVDKLGVKTGIDVKKIIHAAEHVVRPAMLASPEMAYVTGADLFVDGGGEIPAFHTALGSPHG